MDEKLIQRLRSLAGMIPQKHRLPSGADTVICSLEAFMQIKELTKEAADALEELSREYESVAASLTESVELVRKLQNPRWVSVTERLPDYPGRFMCYYEVNDYGEIGHCIDWGRYDPDDGWYASGVTHWMPLPEPPKEEEK